MNIAIFDHDIVKLPINSHGCVKVFVDNKLAEFQLQPSELTHSTKNRISLDFLLLKFGALFIMERAEFYFHSQQLGEDFV